GRRRRGGGRGDGRWSRRGRLDGTSGRGEAKGAGGRGEEGGPEGEGRAGAGRSRGRRSTEGPSTTSTSTITSVYGRDRLGAMHLGERGLCRRREDHLGDVHVRGTRCHPHDGVGDILRGEGLHALGDGLGFLFLA